MAGHYAHRKIRPNDPTPAVYNRLVNCEVILLGSLKVRQTSVSDTGYALRNHRVVVSGWALVAGPEQLKPYRKSVSLFWFGHTSLLCEFGGFASHSFAGQHRPGNQRRTLLRATGKEQSRQIERLSKWLTHCLAWKLQPESLKAWSRANEELSKTVRCFSRDWSGSPACRNVRRWSVAHLIPFLFAFVSLCQSCQQRSTQKPRSTFETIPKLRIAFVQGRSRIWAIQTIFWTLVWCIDPLRNFARLQP